MLLGGAATALVAPAAAAAFVAPGATPVSVSLERREQADDASQFADLASEGRFVVFQTQARNFFADDDPDPPGRFRRGGVFRRDLDTGRLELVAHGTLFEEVRGGNPQALVRGAENPSVSADGRYVAFSTGASLVATDTNDAVDVYVRDMATPADGAGAYDIVSARTGAVIAARYADRDPEADFPGRNPGAELTPGVALSDDGRRVAFRTLVPSDLPEAATASTPAFQVLVRDRLAQRTQLVTRQMDPAAAPQPRRPLEPVPVGQGGPATISADGTTVVWAGQNGPAQTPLLDDESQNPSFHYLLWQRVADGSSAPLREDVPTRRVTGIAEPEKAGCLGGAVSQSPFDDGPCFGPLSFQESQAGSVASTRPALSGDGTRVLFTTGVSPRPITQFPAFDLFVADMRAGVTRRAGTVELTRDTAGGSTETNGAIEGLALSPDGDWAAVTTARTRFLLPALHLVGSPRATADRRELYLVDLRGRTVERILRTIGGADLDADVGVEPSLSRGAARIAFTSGSPSLFRGDANGRIDAFVVTRTDPPPPEASPAPEPEAAAEFESVAPTLDEQPVRRLRVFARRTAAGSVRILVRAPATGSLTTEVRGRLLDRSGEQKGQPRVLASAERALRRRGDTVVTLKLAKRYAAVLRRARRLRAQATVELESPDGSAYEGRVGVVFTAPKKATKAKRTKRPRKRRT